MSRDEPRPIMPPGLDDRQSPQTSRAILGLLLVLLGVAVLIALWALLFRGDSDTEVAAPLPTPVALPTSTPAPAVAAPTTPPVETTAEPVAAPTPVPAGFESCNATASPLTTATYIVDTIETPLNQRTEPSVDGELIGSFDPGATGLVFSGDCVVNLADGYTWWEINNGTADVWVASDFVTPN